MSKHIEIAKSARSSTINGGESSTDLATWRGRLQRATANSPPGTKTTGICRAISGATPILSVLRSPRLDPYVSLSFELGLKETTGTTGGTQKGVKTSSQLTAYTLLFAPSIRLSFLF